MSFLSNIIAPARKSDFIKIAIILVSIDFILISLHIASGFFRYFGDLTSIPYQLDIRRPWGLGSLYTFGKWAFLCVLLLLIWQRTWQRIFLSLFIVFLIVLADDSLEIHERLGSSLKETLGYSHAYGLRAQDFGELTVWAAIGALCLVIFVYGYLKSSNFARGISHVFLLGIGATAIFGIGFDMFDIMVSRLWSSSFAIILEFGLQVIEDGGEMIMASLMSAYAYALFLARHALAASN